MPKTTYMIVILLIYLKRESGRVFSSLKRDSGRGVHFMKIIEYMYIRLLIIQMRKIY